MEEHPRSHEPLAAVVRGEEFRIARSPEEISSRIRGELSLLAVLRDPEFQVLFFQWLKHSSCEHLMEFWIDCENYNSIPLSNIRTMRQRACEIYEKYLTETGPCSVLAVEATTREEIAKTLGVSGSSPRRRLWQDPEKLRAVFRVAMRKTFHTLRFDYLPAFLATPRASILLEKRLGGAVRQGGNFFGAKETPGVEVGKDRHCRHDHHHNHHHERARSEVPQQTTGQAHRRADSAPERGHTKKQSLGSASLSLVWGLVGAKDPQFQRRPLHRCKSQTTMQRYHREDSVRTAKSVEPWRRCSKGLEGPTGSACVGLDKVGKGGERSRTSLSLAANAGDGKAGLFSPIESGANARVSLLHRRHSFLARNPDPLQAATEMKGNGAGKIEPADCASPFDGNASDRTEALTPPPDEPHGNSPRPTPARRCPPTSPTSAGRGAKSPPDEADTPDAERLLPLSEGTPTFRRDLLSPFFKAGTGVKLPRLRHRPSVLSSSNRTQGTTCVDEREMERAQEAVTPCRREPQDTEPDSLDEAAEDRPCDPPPRLEEMRSRVRPPMNGKVRGNLAASPETGSVGTATVDSGSGRKGKCRGCGEGSAPQAGERFPALDLGSAQRLARLGKADDHEGGDPPSVIRGDRPSRCPPCGTASRRDECAFRSPCCSVRDPKRAVKHGTHDQRETHGESEIGFGPEDEGQGVDFPPVSPSSQARSFRGGRGYFWMKSPRMLESLPRLEEKGSVDPERLRSPASEWGIGSAGSIGALDMKCILRGECLASPPLSSRMVPSDFGESLEVLNEEIDFGVLLNDSLGLSLFKRYCHGRYQGENIDLWIEIVQFKRGEYSAPNIGKAFRVGEGDSIAIVRARRARIIFETYISDEAEFQVNISSKLREDVCDGLEQLERMATSPEEEGIEKVAPSIMEPCGVFDDVQREVFQLMELNSWVTFKRSKMYEFFSGKYRTHLARKQRNIHTRKESDKFDPEELITAGGIWNLSP